MALPNRAEIAAALKGLALLLRGDARALQFYDLSLDGFWRSFGLPLFCLAVYLILQPVNPVQAEIWADNRLGFLLMQGLEYLLAWKKFAIVPKFEQGDFGMVYRLQEPENARKGGLQKLSWVVMSCVLFDLDIFRKQGVDIRLFHDHMAVAEDAYYWSYLRLCGVECWQDYRSLALMLRPPTPMWEAVKGKVEIVKEGHDVQTRFERLPPK